MTVCRAVAWRLIDRNRLRRHRKPPPQNVAMGFAGEPVPPRIGRGAAVSRNSQRLRAAAASPSARSQLPKRMYAETQEREVRRAYAGTLMSAAGRVSRAWPVHTVA